MRAAAEAELAAAAAAMDDRWAEVETACEAYSAALWAMLVEKATDLIVDAAVAVRAA